MEWRALGDYRAISQWNGRAKSWGPDNRWRCWFGGQVTEAVVQLLDEHLATLSSQRGAPAAIGCVPWLTHPGVADRLARLSACCIVVDKGQSSPLAEAITAADNGFPNVLPALRTRSPTDAAGNGLIVGPSTPMPEYEVGPVRALGMSGGEPGKPLMHAKLLVLGCLEHVEMEPDGGPTVEELIFEPWSVWWGSANWTKRTESHLEFGAWSDDPQLVENASWFVGDLIAFSEPMSSRTAGPEPDLVSVEWDDAAMAEAAWEQELGRAAEEYDAAEVDLWQGSDDEL